MTSAVVGVFSRVKAAFLGGRRGGTYIFYDHSVPLDLGNFMSARLIQAG